MACSSSGQSLGLLCRPDVGAALWPWRKERAYGNLLPRTTRGGVDLERVAFSRWPLRTWVRSSSARCRDRSGDEAREPSLPRISPIPLKTPLQLAVIGHLHIMLASHRRCADLDFLGAWFDFKGRLHKIAMPLMIAGTLLITGGVWAWCP